MPSWLILDSALLSVANQRFLSTIGIIPTLHILQLIHRGDSSQKWVDLATAVGQATFISFAYAIRATSVWMFVATAAALLYYSASPFLHALRARMMRLDATSVGRIAIARVGVAAAVCSCHARAAQLIRRRPAAWR